uniref:Uncharacterized protein n=1 Tax=Clastoptera arizonana TaxID=38151 RepID=A0A1B6DF36_9HEMI
MSSNEYKKSFKSHRFGDWLDVIKSLYFKPESEFVSLKKKENGKLLDNSGDKSLAKPKKITKKSKYNFKHYFNPEETLEMYKKNNIYTRLRLYYASTLIPRVLMYHKSHRQVSRPTKALTIASPKQEEVKVKKNVTRVQYFLQEKKLSTKVSNIF